MPYVFGYGSIINRYTRTASSPYEAPVRLAGYRREWGAPIVSEKTTSLTIAPRADSSVNGIIVSVPPTLLAELDTREGSVGHSRFSAPWKSASFLSDVPPAHDELFFYAVSEPTRPSEDLPIERTYLDTVLFGCLEYGDAFAREFIRTTDGWDSPWIDDRDHPRYPRWKPSYSISVIDSLLEEELGDVFRRRATRL